MPVQLRGCFFAERVLLSLLMEITGLAFGVDMIKTPDSVTQRGSITLPPTEAFFSFSGNSYLHPALDDENGIIMVAP
jgi:hypothetical protein